MSSIEMNLGAARHGLTLPEAGVLRDWLSGTRSLSAQTLAKSLSDGMEANQPQGIRLGLDDIAALRTVLCGTELSGVPGLESLQAALCPPPS